MTDRAHEQLLHAGATAVVELTGDVADPPLNRRFWKSARNASSSPTRRLPWFIQAFLGAPVTAVLLLATLNSVSNAQLTDSAWPDYGGGYANQHRSPFVGPAGVPQVKWEFNLAVLTTTAFERGYHQPILLPDGTIVLNTADSGLDRVVALNPNGTLRWQKQAGVLGPWLAADAKDQIYTIRSTSSAANSAQLRSYAYDGTVLWSKSLPGSNPTQNGPAVGYNGDIYAAVDHNPLVAFTDTGAVDWTTSQSGYYVNPAIATDGTILIGGQNLTALAPNGATLWQKPVRTASGKFPKFLSPAIGDDGVIYAGQINYSNLIALNPDGSQLWQRTDLDGAPAVGRNGEIYVVPESGVLHALNAATGATLWTYATGKTDYYNAEGVTIDASGDLYVANDQGVLLSLTPNGSLRWSLDLAPGINGFVGLGAPVLGADGLIYVVGGNTGKVFALVPEPSGIVLALMGITSVVVIAPLRRWFAETCQLYLIPPR